jgi:hypothetical protein
MAVTYTFQTPAVLQPLSQNLIQSATLDDPIFKIFPIRRRDTMRVRWSIKDNYKGTMKLRGLGGEPTRVQKVSTNIYEDVPGVYGEFETIDETEMADRARGFPSTMNVPVDVGDLVTESQEHLTIRQVSQMKKICWLLAISGTFSEALPGGGVGHTGAYNQQTVTVSPLWSTTATATPLKNFRDLQPSFGFGSSTMFNGMAEAWMNSATLNYALGNTNAADFGGRRSAGGGTLSGLSDLNRVLLDQGTPTINVWDDGYYDESNTFQLYIPTGKVLVVGKRPNGETPGEFQMTRNMVSNSPAPYSHVDDRANAGPMQAIPPRIDVHQGFSGGPVVERPTQLAVMTVG